MSINQLADNPRRTYWITGASSGIGLELAEQLAREGNYVVASGRNMAALADLQTRYPKFVEPLAFDLTDEHDWPDLPERLNEVLDEIDTLIMAAGVCEYVDNPQCDDDLYRRVFETNFFAAVRTVRVALPFLKRSSQKARIVGVGSLSAQAAFTRAQAYGASKAAFEYWLECQRIDLKPLGIDVTVVSPGFVDTPLTRKNDFAMPGLMTVEKAAHRIISGLEAGKMYVRFPRRLFWPLRMARWLPKFWFGWVAEKMQRSQTL